MELTILGSGGGWARPGGAACGYLVSHQGFDLWVDLGTGTMANLQRYVPLEEVDGVAISHRHFDHFLDLYPFFLAEWYGTDRDPIPLFAPPGMFEHARQLEDKLGNGFDVNVVTPGETFQAGPLAVRTAPMNHPVPTLGMRFEADGSALAYSADTGPSDDLVELARGADLLLCEATWIERPHWAKETHLTARQAGEHAARAGVGNLILTHIWPKYDVKTSADQASEAFGRRALVAREGMRARLGGGVEIEEGVGFDGEFQIGGGPRPASGVPIEGGSA
jgi:ribonuclease BN (tRNA processing enzyme)